MQEIWIEYRNHVPEQYMLLLYAGLSSANIPTLDISVGIPLLDMFIQGVVIFIIACGMGDFSYYWWHRLQYKVPFLRQLHKLHHSDEHLKTTTIYRSHFLEYGGQALFQGLTIGLIFNLTEPPQGFREYEPSAATASGQRS